MNKTVYQVIQPFKLGTDLFISFLIYRNLITGTSTHIRLYPDIFPLVRCHFFAVMLTYAAKTK